MVTRPLAGAVRAYQTLCSCGSPVISRGSLGLYAAQLMLGSFGLVVAVSVPWRSKNGNVSMSRGASQVSVGGGRHAHECSPHNPGHTASSLGSQVSTGASTTALPHYAQGQAGRQPG